MNDITLTYVEKYYGAVKTLENITLDIPTGQTVGIVGRNGAGKSTFFRVIAQKEPVDAGVVTLRKGATLGYLEQIPAYPEAYTVEDVLNTAFADLMELQRAMIHMEEAMAAAFDSDLERLLAAYSEAQEAFTRMGGYMMDAERNRISAGLKVDHLLSESFNDLSGGEMSRVALAAVLLRRPDILLLDEPTNHLDFMSLTWLEEFIKAYRGTVLVITHDRYFLDSVADGIIEIHQKKAEFYIGNYSVYIRERQRKTEAMEEAYALQQRKIDAMEQTIKTLHDWGRRSDNEKFHRRAASIQKRLDKTERLERPAEEKDLSLAFSNNARSGRDVLIARGITKRFGSTTLFQGVNCQVRYGERVAILGPNGCGKSTLLKILMGTMTPDDGSVSMGTGVRIGALMQETTFPNEEATVLEHFRLCIPSTETEARSYLAKYLFFGNDVFRKIGVLSGGERKRLALAVMVREERNLLILDEPTNHLDIDAREGLEEALENFTGTMIFVSHDRYFVNRLAERILFFHDRRLMGFMGNYDDYLVKLNRETITSPTSQASVNPKPISKEDLSKGEGRKQNRRIEEIEDQLTAVERDIKDLEQALTQCGSDYIKAEKIHGELTEKQATLDLLWQKLLEWEA